MKKSVITIFACFCMISMLIAQPASTGWFSKYDSNIEPLKADRSGWQNNHLRPLQQLERIHQLNSYRNGQEATPNSQHRLDSVISVADTKDEYIYDTYNRLIMETSYSYDFGANPWIPSSKIEYAYNASGAMDYKIESEYDDLLNQWVPIAKYNYTYDSLGYLSQEFYSYWEFTSNQWEMSQRLNYTYNNFGHVLLIMYYDYWMSQWELSAKEEYFYTPSLSLTQTIFSFYDSYTMTWEPMYKVDYTYLVSGNLAMSIESYYDGGSGTWVQSSKTEYAYDGMGNVLTETYYFYSTLTNLWEPEWKFEVTYNLSIPIADLIVPFWYRWDYMVTSATDYKWVPNQWMPYWMYTLYYSLQTSRGLDMKEDPAIRVYPNPASDFFYVDFTPKTSLAILSIYDLQGRQVLSKVLSGPERISLSSLIPSMYIYILQDGEKTFSGKLLKE